MTTEYRIADGDTPQVLETLVNELLAGGWHLVGGPFTASWSVGHGYITSLPQNVDGWVGIMFFQAMGR